MPPTPLLAQSTSTTSSQGNAQRRFRLLGDRVAAVWPGKTLCGKTCRSRLSPRGGWRRLAGCGSGETREADASTAAGDPPTVDLRLIARGADRAGTKPIASLRRQGCRGPRGQKSLRRIARAIISNPRGVFLLTFWPARANRGTR